MFFCQIRNCIGQVSSDDISSFSSFFLLIQTFFAIEICDSRRKSDNIDSAEEVSNWGGGSQGKFDALRRINSSSKGWLINQDSQEGLGFIKFI